MGQQFLQPFHRHVDPADLVGGSDVMREKHQYTVRFRGMGDLVFQDRQFAAVISADPRASEIAFFRQGFQRIIQGLLGRAPPCPQMVEIRRHHPVGHFIAPIVRIGETADRQTVFPAGVQLRGDLFGNIFFLSLLMDERQGIPVMERMESNRVTGRLELFHHRGFFRGDLPDYEKRRMGVILFEQGIGLEPAFAVIIIESKTNRTALFRNTAGQPHCTGSHHQPSFFHHSVTVFSGSHSSFVIIYSPEADLSSPFFSECGTLWIRGGRTGISR